MKNLSHIVNKVYGSPWLIQPLVHKTITTQLENILLGKTELPFQDVEEVTKEEINTSDVESSTAVIMVDGIIGKHLSMLETMCGGLDLDQVAFELKAARDNEAVKQIVIYFNTPGGSVTGVKEVGELIKSITTIKPVIGYTDTLCASAGYWLASQCSAFYCSPSSDVGSIGVYSIFLDETRAIEDMGVKVNAISAGKYKLTGASFKVMTDEERTMLQDDVNVIYTDFKAAITSNREVEDESMQGQCFVGTVALEKGLVDGLVNDFEGLMNFLTTTR